MADGLGYNPSVALGTNAPSPTQGLDTLAKVMNLGSMGLSIQSQKAELQQQQLKSAQAQGVQDFFKSWDPTQHLSPDGTTDADSVHSSSAYKNAGNAKPLIDQTLIQIKNGQLQNKQALSTLDDGLINRYGQTMGTLANDPEVKAGGINGQAKVKEALSNFGQLQPEAARLSGILGSVISKAPKDAQGNIPNLAHLVQSQQMMGADVLGQRSQQGTPTTIDSGSKIQPGTTAPAIEGGGFTASGPAIKKETPPTIITNAAGQATRIAPGGTGASVIPTQAAPGQTGTVPNANPTEAQAAGQAIQAKAVGDRVSQVQTQAANTVQAQDALSRARAIIESPESPDTGALFEKKKQFKNALSSLGIDTGSADDMNTLTKNLARFEATRATAAGLGGTDAARELAHNGSPNTQLDNKALQGIVRQSLATEKVLAGYANVQSRTNDPQQQLKNEAAFRALPHPIETTEYMMSRNKTEAEAYLKSHNLSHDDIAKSAAAIKQFSTP